MIIINYSYIQSMQPSITNYIKHIQLINIAQPHYNFNIIEPLKMYVLMLVNFGSL
jgi:hypothetical protein